MTFIIILWYHTKSKGAQEAHEAIRPTYISNVEAGATSQEKRLYEIGGLTNSEAREMILEKVETEMVKLQADIEVEEFEHSIEGIEVTIFILQHIEQKEQLDIRSIF